MNTVLDCGHVIEWDKDYPRNRFTELITTPDGSWYDFEYPHASYYDKEQKKPRQRFWNYRKTWDYQRDNALGVNSGLSKGEKLFYNVKEIELKRICHKCAATVHLEKIKKDGKGMFFLQKPEGWIDVHRDEHDRVPRFSYPYRKPSSFKVEHGRSGETIAECLSVRVKGHNWWHVAQLYVYFRWDNSTWIGRNVFGEYEHYNDCLHVRRLYEPKVRYNTPFHEAVTACADNAPPPKTITTT
jgi:hypothetical protein